MLTWACRVLTGGAVALTLGAAPVGASALPGELLKLLKTQVVAFEARDADFLVEIGPPRLLPAFIRATGLGQDQAEPMVRQLMQHQLDRIVTDLRFTINPNAAIPIQSDGAALAAFFVPSRIVTIDQGQPALRYESHVLAVQEDGAWSAMTVHSEEVMNLIRFAYPELQDTAFPGSDFGLAQ